MPELIPAGSEVSAGTYKCARCGYRMLAGTTKRLPICPQCGNDHYLDIMPPTGQRVARSVEEGRQGRPGTI